MVKHFFACLLASARKPYRIRIAEYLTTLYYRRREKGGGHCSNTSSEEFY